eukprot:883111-Pyramimonas_sp.AAC.1
MCIRDSILTCSPLPPDCAHGLSQLHSRPLAGIAAFSHLWWRIAWSSLMVLTCTLRVLRAFVLSRFSRLH